MLPDQLRCVLCKTDLEFTKPGVAGHDVIVKEGVHPLEYTSWPKGVMKADFKPNTSSGLKTFVRDQRVKWKEPTFVLPYNPVREN